MQMPGRDTTFKTAYRYGFNGKEMDNEPYGQGNEYDYGFRIYNPRVGKFLSVDPLTNKYPELTPYQFASNQPIDGVDLDGLEHFRVATMFYDKKGKLDMTTTLQVEHATEQNEAEIGYGEVDAVQSAAQGLWNIIRHPINTVKGLYKTVTHPVQTFNTAKNKIANDFKENPNKALGNTIVNSLLLTFGGELFNGSKIVEETEFLTSEEFTILSEEGAVNVNKIRFSQNSISEEITDATESSKMSLDDFIRNLKNGTIDPSKVKPIRIVEKDGNIFTLDNRRLYAYRQAGIKEIPYKKLNEIPKNQGFKFTTTNEGTSIVVRKKK